MTTKRCVMKSDTKGERSREENELFSRRVKWTAQVSGRGVEKQKGKTYLESASLPRGAGD